MKPLATLLAIVGCTIFNCSYAQQAACGGGRFLEAQFEVGDPVTVKFGENTTVGGNFQELYMDVYEPVDDGANMRPAMVLAFGGGFIQGDRTQLDFLCRHFAAKGYVCASIDYRLYDAFPLLPDSLTMADVVIKSVGDVKAAIRHLRMDAATGNLFRIDPDYIIAGGVSAGAIATLHAAYLDEGDDIPGYIQTLIDANGGFEGNSGSAENLTYSSEIQGMLNLLGGLHKDYWISQNEPPMVSMHGTADDIVSYGEGFAGIMLGPTLVGMSIYGSGALHPRCQLEGIPSTLITVEGGGHGEFLSDPTWLDSLYTTASQFLHDEVVCNAGTAVHQPDLAAARPQIAAYPNPAAGIMNIKLDRLHTSGRCEALLYDAAGKLVLRQNVTPNAHFTLNAGKFPKGAYLLQITDPAGIQVSEKLLFH